MLSNLYIVLVFVIGVLVSLSDRDLGLRLIFTSILLALVSLGLHIRKMILMKRGKTK